MIDVTINGISYSVLSESTILTACKSAGFEIPQYCYHESLSIAGNCRMCLIELEEVDRIVNKFQPVSSCTLDFEEDDVIIMTDSVRAMKARESVAAFLLINHPLDCPICDQGGDCDLQDQSKNYGQDIARFLLSRRSVLNKFTGFLIKTIMTRCIQCTRCVRFGEELNNKKYFGTVERGTAMEISTYIDQKYFDEISGTVIDLCPVGALTSNSFDFQARPWELTIHDTIDTQDSVGSNIKIALKGRSIVRVSAKYNKNLNQGVIADIARFYFDNFFSSLKTNTQNNSEFSQRSLVFKLKNLFVTNTFKNYFLLVNPNIGIEEFLKIKQYSFINSNFSINSNVSKYYNKSNSYFYNLYSSINELNNAEDFALLIGFNPRVECAAINARIKKHQLKSTLQIVGFGSFFENNNQFVFLNFNLKKLFTIFEGKSEILSRILINSESIFLLINDSINDRGLNVHLIYSFLKKYCITTKCIHINKVANNQALDFFNINAISSFNVMTLNKTKSLILSNDKINSQNSNKLFYKLKTKTIIALNSSTFNFLKIKEILYVPLVGLYDQTKIYFNFENRSQLVKQIFNKTQDKFLISRLLTFLPNINKNINKEQIKNFKWVNFITETAKNASLFDLFIKKYSYNIEINNINQFNFLYHYPIKLPLDLLPINKIIKKY